MGIIEMQRNDQDHRIAKDSSANALLGQQEDNRRAMAANRIFRDNHAFCQEIHSIILAYPKIDSAR